MIKALLASLCLFLCICFSISDSSSHYHKKLDLKNRRYDIKDLGYEEYFHGWVDVQGQGGANDYCRVIGEKSKLYLACALGGTHGKNDKFYKSKEGFDMGYPNTWYMKDEDGDGRDDYCRCVGSKGGGNNTLRVECMRAGQKGFYGSPNEYGSQFSFSPTGHIECNTRKVRPEFGYPQWDWNRFN